MTGGWDEAERALLEVVTSFAERELAPRAADDDAAARFPRDAVGQLADLGVTGLTFPESLGGGGQPYRLYLQVLEALARAHVVVALSVSVHALATALVVRGAGEELRQRAVGSLVAGEALGAYCLSEPHSGSDAAALQTTARRRGDHYVLRGTKAWVTHAGHADWYVVMARHTDARGAPVPGPGGITALCVPGDADGLEVGPPERKMGMAASPTAVVHLDDVAVPVAHRLGAEGEGFKLALGGLDGGRLGIAAIAVGLAQRALDESVVYARDREQFGQPIGRFQGVGFLLADMATGVEAARALVDRAARDRDAGRSVTRLAAMAKLLATDTAMQASIDAVQVHGGYGYTTEYPVERLLREAKVMQIFEGTNQIQRHVIARDLLA